MGSIVFALIKQPVILRLCDKECDVIFQASDDKLPAISAVLAVEEVSIKTQLSLLRHSSKADSFVRAGSGLGGMAKMCLTSLYHGCLWVHEAVLKRYLCHSLRSDCRGCGCGDYLFDKQIHHPPIHQIWLY